VGGARLKVAWEYNKDGNTIPVSAQERDAKLGYQLTCGSSYNDGLRVEN
jgi:hypothetical protein